MSSYCSYCYAKDVPLQTCAQCHKRKYCSRECQKKDWNSGQNHKYFCCKAGEFNLDFEIKPSPGRGMGMFALRDFSKNEYIIAERPLLENTGRQWNTSEYSMLKDSEKQAFQDLSGETMFEKYQRNKFGGNFKIFALISRVNHDCIGNTFYIPLRGSMVLVAKRDIKAGEEILFAYIHMVYRLPEQRRIALRREFGFDCNLQCSLCSNPDLDERAKELSLKQQQYLLHVKDCCDGKCNTDMNMMLRTVREIRELHNELNVNQSARVQFLNQVSVYCMISKNVKVARELLEESLDIAILCMNGDMDAPAVSQVHSTISYEWCRP
ncbi:hypothetical protein CTEN210_02563 [Chaetoceros tenuissimus]|uniref:MYND-type domain-containing protein n=1 Tax=Chaetoceros tenuissimus TaxID=426638 RepID=A0AAD3CI59_9STRA|nr:hypothetical protein CTEN210_02563 [Chaetoceros tenuissimus]